MKVLQYTFLPLCGIGAIALGLKPIIEIFSWLALAIYWLFTKHSQSPSQLWDTFGVDHFVLVSCISIAAFVITLLIVQEYVNERKGTNI